MPSRLNLSIDDETAKQIKHYAEKNKTTISKIAEDQFKKLTTKSKTKSKSFSEKFAGTLSFHIPDIEQAKEDYLKEKYGV